MPWINTATDLLEGRRHPQQEQVYNGLDCMITLEVHGHLTQLMAKAPEPQRTYAFERALQGPALSMMLRGFRVDQTERRTAIDELEARIIKLGGRLHSRNRFDPESQLQRIAYAVWDKELNPKSPSQLIEFFYGKMRLPELWTSHKGVRKLSMDREALERLSLYLYARPIINLVLDIRDLSKQREALITEVDRDGRMRTSYNIAGTETGRWSSSGNAFGTGGNLQNIADKLRKIFVADQGWKICGIDLEQAESREVGWLCGTLFGDWSYLEATETGELHTYTSKFIWPRLGWNGEADHDRRIADSLFYRDMSYRDMAKRGGHGCLTADHEVLTPSGWVTISNLPPFIMTWHPTGGSRFESPSHWTERDWSGDLLHLQATSLDAVVTPEHRIYYYKDRRNPIHCTAAEQLPRSGVIPLGGNYIGGTVEVSTATARLLAAYQCDGHQNSLNRVSFHMNKERKFARLQQLAQDAFVPYKRSENKAWLEWTAPYPKAAGPYLLHWPFAALTAYIDEHKYWDGHISRTATTIFSKDRTHLEWLQTIGRLIGIGGNIQLSHVSGFGTTIFRLQQNNRSFADLESLTLSRAQAECKVYCPTVPFGAFYIRRNGKISITGNSNYLGTPFTMARHLKVPTRLMEHFQSRYFGAFPAIARWHQWVAKQLQTTQLLRNAFGRTRHFFGRPNDDTTLREAIAFGPQSSTADRLNLILWRVWHYMPEVELLAQVHDALYFQFPDSADELATVNKALRLCSVPLTRDSRVFDVPGEAKTGWNWGRYDPKSNPDGLRKLQGRPDPRRRLSIMERPL